LYVNFQITLKDFLIKTRISENAVSSYGKVKMLYITSTLTVIYRELLSNYIMIHGPQNVK